MTDYWQKFLKSGSVADYLEYRNSLKAFGEDKTTAYERDVEGVRNSAETDKDKGERRNSLGSDR